MKEAPFPRLLPEDLSAPFVLRAGRSEAPMLERDVVRHHAVRGDRPELEALDDVERVEVVEADEPPGLGGWLAHPLRRDALSAGVPCHAFRPTD